MSLNPHTTTALRALREMRKRRKEAAEVPGNQLMESNSFPKQNGGQGFIMILWDSLWANTVYISLLGRADQVGDFNWYNMIQPLLLSIYIYLILYIYILYYKYIYILYIYYIYYIYILYNPSWITGTVAWKGPFRRPKGDCLSCRVPSVGCGVKLSGGAAMAAEDGVLSIHWVWRWTRFKKKQIDHVFWKRLPYKNLWALAIMWSGRASKGCNCCPPFFFRWRLEDTGEDHLSPLGVEAVDTRGTSCVTNWDMLFAGLHVCRMLGRWWAHEQQNAGLLCQADWRDADLARPWVVDEPIIQNHPKPSHGPYIHYL